MDLKRTRRTNLTSAHLRDFQFRSNSLEQRDLVRYAQVGEKGTKDPLRVNLKLQNRVNWSFKMSVVGRFSLQNMLVYNLGFL